MQKKKFKTSFFKWFEVKVCILKSEAVNNDQNSVLFLGHPVWLELFYKITYHKCKCFYLPIKCYHLLTLAEFPGALNALLPEGEPMSVALLFPGARFPVMIPVRLHVVRHLGAFREEIGAAFGELWHSAYRAHEGRTCGCYGRYVVRQVNAYVHPRRVQEIGAVPVSFRVVRLKEVGISEGLGGGMCRGWGWNYS